MRCALFLLVLTAALAQDSTAPLLTDKAAQDLATRMLQLMESTSVAVPDLMRTGDPIRKSAEATVASLARAGHDAALTWQFIGQVKAWLALSDAVPRPFNSLPPRTGNSRNCAKTCSAYSGISRPS